MYAAWIWTSMAALVLAFTDAWNETSAAIGPTTSLAWSFSQWHVHAGMSSSSEARAHGVLSAAFVGTREGHAAEAQLYRAVLWDPIENFGRHAGDCGAGCSCWHRVLGAAGRHART